MARLLASFAIALACAAGLWWVIAPPKGVDGYRERAALTTQVLRSQVQSTRIALDSLGDERLPHSAALVGFEEAERDAHSAASTFEGFEPPGRVGSVRTRFVTLADRTSSALADLRIAAQQERWDELQRLGAPLPGLAEDLKRFERRAKP